jgi:glutamate-ammonia-ligase adenylyltransferase
MSEPSPFVLDHLPIACPLPADPALAAIEWERWAETARAAADPVLRERLEAASQGTARRWLDAVFGNSPYLTRLAFRDPPVVADLLARGPEATLAEVTRLLNREDPGEHRAALMSRLRVAKRQVALVTGMADIAGLWPLERVTGALSRFADQALQAALTHLLRAASAAGKVQLADAEAPARGCGIFVLGMGKLGAFELNYSSDIDLIVLYDGDRLRPAGRDGAQEFVTRLARDLVRIMEERTGDGYVFRTDLRLRPDPRSTPLAVSVEAAETYYGSVGQNWERAALIKARAVAGDEEAARAFRKALTPFLWRKHLDFAAIQDIHSIKRQIDARQGGPPPTLAGYNVKLGHGGIREIEFFAQTQQLIWGGRMPALRTAGTVETLAALAAAGRVEPQTASDLTRVYRFLRRVEHRLQMVDDQQTHSLPADPAGLQRIAIFLGYPGTAEFVAELRAALDLVRARFRALFPDAPSLSAEGNLVFTGIESDPETLETIGRLGFHDAEAVAEAIRGWHHGRIRATRSARARELLTELVPELLRVFGRTPEPDLAFARFDEFLGHLPAGVQLLSLFQRNAELLGLVAEIMGRSPLLAGQLARRPALLDAVISGGFFEPLPEAGETALAALRSDLALFLSGSADYEEVLNLARRWTGDRRFQIGVQLLQGRIDGQQAGRDFSLVAEAVIEALLPEVEADFARIHGAMPGGAFAVLAFGKLGSREMNVLSDLDLVFVYRAPAETEGSTGPRKLPVMAYYARLAQRVINALSAPTSEGGLYEVDMRLRPSGNAGPIASSLEAFRRYYDEQAWTWERMALTRARVIAGDAALAGAIDARLGEILTRKPADAAALLADVADMRERIARAHPSPRPWDCKHRRGALVDLEFIAQYLMLLHAPRDPSLLSWRTATAFHRLAAAGILDEATAATCLDALRFWQSLQQVLRVLLGKVETAEIAPELLASALAVIGPGSEPAYLDRAAESVMAVYERLVAGPARLTTPAAGGKAKA